MAQYKSQIQNMFLSTVRKKHQPVEVVLNTGTTLRGKVKNYDQFSITLAFKEKSEVIYKSAILYITALPKRKRRAASKKIIRQSLSKKTLSNGEILNKPYEKGEKTSNISAKLALDESHVPSNRLDKIIIDDDPPPPRKPPKI